jgi:hypothetical protein
MNQQRGVNMARSIEMPDIVWEYIKDADPADKLIPNCDVKILCLTIRHLRQTILELREIIEKQAEGPTVEEGKPWAKETLWEQGKK